jgi:ethylbenzene dioxygenase alpha subunit
MSTATAEAVTGARAGRIDRRIFWDQEIYDQELERIFARCWNFVAHESQIAEPGSFIQAWMGQDQVLVVRQRDGSIAAFLNTCPHRGNRVCHAEAGKVRSFVCNYHGWAFGLDGRLKGVHESAAYERDGGWDPSEIGLTPVAQLDSYKGLVFATFDPDAPSLGEYLGDFRWYLDVVLDNDPEGTEFVGGSIRSVMRCNWKIAAENFAGDALHAGWTHDSGANAMLGSGVSTLADDESYQANVNGHGWEFNLDTVGNAATLGDRRIIDYLRERTPSVIDRLGETRARMVGSISSANVFPNLSFLPGQNTWRVWVPKGPALTELHTWVLVNRGAPQEIKDAYRRGAMMTFSPSGVFEMDDGENWEYSTRGNQGVVTRRQRLHYGLGLDSRIEHPVLPGNVHRSQLNDANQRAFYGRWADLMAAPTRSDVA